MNTVTIDTILTSNSKPEDSKGYWTAESTGFINFAILSETEGPMIALASNHWYRIQYFQLQNDFEAETAWTLVKNLLKQCGRTLPTASDENLYRLGNLSLPQANQMYYLLKHSLTSEGIEFALKHSFTLNALCTIPAPIDIKKKRKRRGKNSWKVVGGSNFLSNQEDL
jgi:hypothetical protein